MIKTSVWKPYGESKFEFRVGKTQVIIPMQHRRCPRGFLFKLANGEMVVAGAMTGIDFAPDRFLMPLPPGQTSSEMSWRRSNDGGETWHETPAWPCYNVYQFPDGEIIQVSGGWYQPVPDRPGAYSANLYSSTDNGLTFKKGKALLTGIPELGHLAGRPQDDEHYYIQMCERILRLHDGSLLASMQGKFKDDIKERVFVMQSIDRGKTWSYLSTVAFDLTKGKELRPLGFDEPHLLLLTNNEVLCFMRTGGRRGGALYVSRSKDDGKSWDCADPIADRGVEPGACLMKNGVIAVVYGRPGDWLTFSLDQGETWIEHFCFNQSMEPDDCGNYDWVDEVAPDTLLVIYNRPDPDDPYKSEIMGTFITVSPGKPEQIDEIQDEKNKELKIKG